MELIKKAGKPTVIVDYAHTPDALEKALNSARQHCKGKLWCILVVVVIVMWVNVH